MSTVKRQHYVPQFYLRNFTIDENESRIHVFDKAQRRSFTAAISSIASRKHYYDVAELDAATGESQALEKWLGEHEGRVAPVIAALLRTISSGSFVGMSDDERVELATFMALQRVRTEESRETRTQFWQVMPTEILDAFPELAEAARAAQTPQGQAREHASLILDPRLLERIATCLLTRTWVMQRNRTPEPFMTSDYPVVLASLVPGQGAIGPCSPNVEVALPISPEFLLSVLPFPYGSLPPIFDVGLDDARRYNLMQIDQATAQIYSAKAEFPLALERVQTFPEIADPRRTRIVTNCMHVPRGLRQEK